MHRILSLSTAILALHIVGAATQEIPSCVAQCASQVQANFPQFGCANAQDAGCLCPSVEFNNGIGSCALDGCGASPEDVQSFLTSPTGLCLAIPPPVPSVEEPSPTLPAPSEIASETPSEAPEPTTEPSPTPTEEAAPEETTAETTVESTTLGFALPETTALPFTTEISTSASPSTTSSPAPSTTSTRPASTSTEAASEKHEEEKEKDDEDEEAGSGLSTAASIGIGVGVGAAAIAVAAVGLCLFMRNRRRQNPTGQSSNIEISRPMPVGGDYHGDRGSYEKYQADIELTTNRYDDMPPCQEPRTMV